jgi:hypothetical protein
VGVYELILPLHSVQFKQRMLRQTRSVMTELSPECLSSPRVFFYLRIGSETWVLVSLVVACICTAALETTSNCLGDTTTNTLTNTSIHTA